ncbi:MAG: hypothetical protein AAF821_22865 [Cyanobacteria bacterium P01_D01_bin.156]
MGSLRHLLLGIILTTNLLMADNARASVTVSVTPLEHHIEDTFHPKPTGMPQRRLSGGTR